MHKTRPAPKAVSKPRAASKIKPKKYRWHDGTGHHLSAGGILPYDKNGIWVLGEKTEGGSGIVWSDIGGRYAPEDIDIYTTIAREFNEELYHTAELTRSHMIRLSKLCPPLYVNGHDGKPCYICYPVPVNLLFLVGVNMSIITKNFHKGREYALKANPDAKHFYKSQEIKYASFKDFPKFSKTEKIGYRLNQILIQMQRLGMGERSPKSNDQ